MDNQTRGRRIREARLMLGMSMRDLAQVLSISYQCVFCWEKGIRSPRPKYLPPLAKALNIEVRELVID